MKRAVSPKEMHNYLQKKDLQAVENNLEHEEVHEFRKSSRAAARQMAAQEAIARKKEGPPPTKEAPPTVVAEKHSARAAATLHTRTP